MSDRIYVEKAADTGALKNSLLETSPSRYMLRSLGAGMFLSIVVFVFWVLMHNLRDMSLGKAIASCFFGVGLTGIVFTKAELFTSR
jgi:nitrite transporter NirC